MSRGNSHIAGCHLFDPDTGQYNVPYISRYLPGIRTTVINLAYRDIGLMVKPGNPLNIVSIKDLSRPAIKIINRQQGSGTRVLFDYELKKMGIEPNQVDGYEKEVNTHFEVAMAVVSGSADVGLGILSAAKMLNLTFIHLTNEQYDFVIPRENLSAQPIVSLVDSNTISGVQTKHKPNGRIRYKRYRQGNGRILAPFILPSNAPQKL